MVSTPLAAPVIAATRLRGGNAASARGAASLAAKAIGTARDCGCTGMIIVRLDSAFYNAAVIGAVRRGAARTARHGRGLLTVHLPEGWHREQEWLNLLGACGPPAAAA